MAVGDDIGCPVQRAVRHHPLYLRATSSHDSSVYLDDLSSFTWMTFDYLCDAVYVIDMLLRSRTGQQNEV